MIDSGLFLASLNRKKDSKKKNTIINQNNSVNRLHNNHLYGLCSKFNNNLHFNGKKVENYMKTFKKIKTINNKKFIDNCDKIHMKYNSMRLEDFYGLKGKKKNINVINTNKIGNTSNNNKLTNNEQKHYNTISNEDFAKNIEINKKFSLKSNNK